jgi:plastocyanin
VSKKFVWGCLGVAGAALLLGSCGGGGSSTGPSPTGGGTNPGGSGSGAGSTTTTITITNNAISPRTVTIAQGTQVMMVNNDSRSHLMASDPHPEHTDCPEINQVGFLNPGQSRLTGNLNTVRTCGFHDHNQPLVSSLQGTIVIRN